MKRPRHTRLPPAWVRRADWTWSGPRPAFRFPHLQADEDAEIAQLRRLWDWAEDHPSVFTAWLAKVDAYRVDVECCCPQCALAREGRA